MFQEFSSNYKSGSVMFAEYQQDDFREKIILEKRKGANLRCELFTKISGNTHHVFSGIFRGCLSSLLQELPPNARISIAHIVPAETANGFTWLKIVETVMNEREINSEPRQSIFFTWELNGNSGKTNLYEMEDSLDALEEIRNIVCANGVIKICPYCAFMEYLSNTSMCLRNLDPDEFLDVQERMNKRRAFSEYYGKIAWDIEEFHFCSAFLERE